MTPPRIRADASTGNRVYSHNVEKHLAALRVKAALYIAALLLVLPTAAPAGGQGMFATSDQSPFIQLYSLPSPAETPALKRGSRALALRTDITSNSIMEQRAGERIALDGETYRTVLEASLGLSDRLAVGLTLPFVAHSGGFLDSIIHAWHDSLGLSNSRRDDFPRNELEYSYAGEPEQFALFRRSRGIGDLRLTADWRLHDGGAHGRSLAARGGLKLATGAPERLHGSGSTDVSVQLLSTDRATLAAWDTTLAWMIGGLWLGDSEVLGDLRRDAVAIASVGLSRPVWGALSLRLQLDGHTSFYDTSLRPIGANSVQLTFGGTVELARAGRIDIAMIENLSTDTTPDVTLHLGWRRHFRNR